jgi:hypothetical protein
VCVELYRTLSYPWGFIYKAGPEGLLFKKKKFVHGDGSAVIFVVSYLSLANVSLSYYYMVPISGNSIRLPGAYAPSTKKLYFEMSKNLDKKFYMYIFIIYVRSSSFTKNQYFVWSI